MILGITGSFGCGKSTVLSLFRRANWHVFDADQQCHEFYKHPSGSLLNALMENGFRNAVTASGEILRGELGKIVFSDPVAMDRLTALVYPLLFEELEKTIRVCREKEMDGAFELPLLFECGKEKMFDAVLCIWTAPEIRCRRLRDRGFDEAEFRRREARQMDPDEKLERADFALINNGSEEELQKQLLLLLVRLSEKENRENHK